VGNTLIIVDHKIDFLDALCDRLVVLELGQVIARGRPDEVWRDERVISAYLGTSLGEPADAAD
jgi:ABC-type branched-subunit amino acid transport system ATPase component